MDSALKEFKENFAGFFVVLLFSEDKESNKKMSQEIVILS